MIPITFAFAADGGGADTINPTSTDFSDTKAQNGAPLVLERSFPYEDYDHAPVDTVGIKLYFDGDVTDESIRDINNAKGMFEFSGGKTEKITTKAYFNKKDNGYILVTATKTKDGNAISLNPNSRYKLTISGKLTSADGRILGEDKVVDFRTVDTSGNTQVYMLLMVAMVAGMILMTFVSNRRKARAKAIIANSKPANPYKLAKEKGITLEEALAIAEKDKLRREKLLKTAGIDPKSLVETKGKGSKGHKVNGPRPISAGGSAYKTGRKAIAEQKAKKAAAKRAAGTTNSKKKGKGGKKKKK
jgi:hypothetical protein